MITNIFTVLFFISYTWPTVSSLVVHGNETISFISYYTTLGGGPTSSLVANITLISNDNVTPNCEFKYIDESTINGNIVVYTDQELPLLYLCCSDRHGIPTAFARMMERRGAVGVVITEYQKVLFVIYFLLLIILYTLFTFRNQFMQSRVTGFNPAITIPLVVVDDNSMNYLKQMRDDSTRIELTPITFTGSSNSFS
jgi:hypothetical protein